MKIFLYYIGKPRDEHANAMAAEYIRRASRYARVEMREIQPARFDPWQKHSSATKILLDPAGKVMDSPQIRPAHLHSGTGRPRSCIPGRRRERLARLLAGPRRHARLALSFDLSA